ncbi:MAG: PQQ-like beta-propeller repeat protein [Rhodopirellula sp.]|nr:PQQ-like beta-propeller repeat protein [Rhodopirellula sp.]
MFSIGRIPVLRNYLLTCCAFCLLWAGPPLVNAQNDQAQDDQPQAEPRSAPNPKPLVEPEGIAVPITTAKPLSRVAEFRWVSPPGYATDRELVMRLTRFQDVARGPWPEDLNWTDVLEKVHVGILASSQDTLVTPDEQSLAGSVPPAPHPTLGRPLKVLRSLKGVTEEIIADLPPVGRDAWLRLVSERAEVEFAVAARDDDWKTINRIASQDAHTPACYNAIDLLGNRYLDQNHPLAALRQFHRLLTSETARESREPLLSIRTAVAWSNLGRPQQARLTIIELALWLSKRPAIAAAVPEELVPDVSHVSEWLRNNPLPVSPPEIDSGNDRRFYAAGLLPQASTPAFSPDSRVLWKSLTSGFNVSISAEDRAKFQRRFDDEDINAEDPYPESESETAALVEVGLAHLARRDQRQKSLAMPACEPIVTNGQAVFRTLNRIRSVDLKTGQLQWESLLTDAAFAEQFNLRQASRSVNVPTESNDILNPLNQRQSAVIYSRTRLDQTAGTLSTDGRTLFALEDGGVTAKATSYRQPGLRQAAPRSWNRLCAFDLNSGILRWQIGGPEGEHELPAAGMFFLGVPTVIDDSAYVIGEQSTWVRLFCLEPATGKIKWVQPIGTANVAIDLEGLRRVGGISPCCAEGMIICPTMSGLVVAFDPQQQRLAWTSSYRTLMTARAVARGMFRGPVPISTINLDSPDRWRHDSTILRSGRIIMSPLDSQELICLDAISGDTLWTQPRGRGLFVGAAFDDQIIVVDDSAVRSLSVNDGALNWTVRLNQRVPTGRGLRVGSLFHLPVATAASEPTATENSSAGDVLTDSSPEQNGKLVTIDLSAGRLLAESKSPDGLPLGNLVAHEGSLVTQRFDSVIALESLSSVESQLARQLEQKPGDSGVLESRARIRLHEGRLQEGLSDLQMAVLDKNSTSALNLLIEQALEQLRHGQKLNNATQQVLSTAPLDARQRNAIDAVRSERLMTDGNFTAAFDLLLESPRIDPATGREFVIHADPLSVSSKPWVAAQLQSVYGKAGTTSSDSAAADAVKEMDLRIRERFNKAMSSKDPAELRNWLSLFSWHNDFAEAAVALAGRLDSKNDALEIDSLLAVLSLHPDARFSEDGKSRRAKSADAAVWPDVSPKVTTASHGLNADRRILVDVSGRRSPVIQGWEFELTLNGLTALSPTGNPLWTLSDEDLGSDPLLTTSRHGSSRIFSSGHLLAVSTGTEFSVFDLRQSPPRRLWKRSFVSRDAEGFLQMRQTHLLGSSVLISGNTSIGSLDFLNSHSLVYRTGSTLRVVSATSGETIWTRDHIPEDALIFGDELVLSVAHLRSAHCQLFDIRNGRLIKEHFDIPLAILLATSGPDPIVRQNRGTTHVISRFNMRTGQPRWEHEFPNYASILPIEEDRLVEFHPEGRILVREQSTGAAVFDVQVDKQLIPGRFFLHETPTEYVLFSATPQRGIQSRIGPLNLQGSRQDKVEGPAYGINRRTGKLLWTVNVEPQYFAAGQPSQLPFVVLACWSSPERPNGQFGQSGRTHPIRILDTRTGNTLFATEGKENDDVVLNYRSAGDAEQKQASVTYAKTVIHFDYSDSPQDSAPPQD